ncbi:MAG: HEAT repeat domain-containing protein [Verrucomicrobia bacterium]|nr:HEAT repeat domain-containing protein [Verrucomicrobiota bacterium]
MRNTQPLTLTYPSDSMKTLKPLSSAIAATAVLTAVRSQADPVEDLVTKIKSTDDKVRGPAWQGAASAGAAAVKPLADVMSNADMEVARAAKRAVWVIVRHAGRPGADGERKAVQAALLGCLKDQPAPVRKEALWMLSEIGDAEVVAPMAMLLADAEVREEARCALMRLAGPQVTEALNKAFQSAPEEFKSALAESLRQRGQTVSGYPSQKRVPVKQTSLTPTPPATKPGS